MWWGIKVWCDVSCIHVFIKQAVKDHGPSLLYIIWKDDRASNSAEKINNLISFQMFNFQFQF